MRGLLYLVILLAVTGCSCTNSRMCSALDEIAVMMQSDPGQAMDRLNSYDISEFNDSAMMARWALLYSEALSVNGLMAPTDTIVDIAIDYYERHNQVDELQRALQLKKMIRSDCGSDPLATALYIQKEKEFFLYKERVRREMYMLYCLIILLVSSVLILWMRQRLRVQSLRNETLMAEASGLKCQIDASRGDVGRLEAKLHGLLEDRFALIDSLCQTYYESQGTKTERKAIIDKVKSEIESVRTDSFDRMEQVVNDCRDNLLVKVREYYPEIRPEDYQLLVYLASGLSTRAMSLLLGESVDVVYKRKSRLKARLKDSISQSCPEIVAIF